MIKPTLPKGMRDFLPQEVAKRQYIINTIKTAYEKYGFQPIETPVMENLETLTGKYGDEGDKLLFKVLNNGNYLKDVELENSDYKALTSQISGKGLRYDLTVPLARYVVQHQNELTFPFKRYHIAPVWRADRPQKGRYREFYQCDADILGSKSLINEVELAQIFAEVFNTLNLEVSILINSRKLLMGLMEAVGLQDQATKAITILDKLDKIGLHKVMNEISELNITEENLTNLKKAIEENTVEHLPTNDLLEAGKIEINYLKKFEIRNSKFEISLARGLDYYTGIIFEVVTNEVKIGSIAGGGRYDNLTELFGKKDLTGVGISFGLDRIYDVLEETNKFPENLRETTQVLFTHFDEDTFNFAFKQLQVVKNAGICAEIYPDRAKLKKQMKYANDKKIPFVVVIGQEEMINGELSLKNMQTGEQEQMRIEQIISKLNA